MRKDGRLLSVGRRSIGSGELNDLVDELQEGHRRRVSDTSFALDEECRFRAHLFLVQSEWALVLRVIPPRIPLLSDLRLPPPYEALCGAERGVILIGGESGSGRSTTLAAMAQTINLSRSVHVVVIEEPIEHLYRDERASISQVEVFNDAASWESALETAVRSDVDVIVLSQISGEVVIRVALEAAELGILVLAGGGGSTPELVLGRLLAQVSGSKRPALQESLARQLKAVACQRLIPGGLSRLEPNCEILIATNATRSAIASGEFYDLGKLVRIGDPREGMLSFDAHLEEMLSAGRISRKTALEHAFQKRQFEIYSAEEEESA